MGSPQPERPESCNGSLAPSPQSHTQGQARGSRQLQARRRPRQAEVGRRRHQSQVGRRLRQLRMRPAQVGCQACLARRRRQSRVGRRPRQSRMRTAPVGREPWQMGRQPRLRRKSLVRGVRHVGGPTSPTQTAVVLNSALRAHASQDRVANCVYVSHRERFSVVNEQYRCAHALALATWCAT